MERRGPTSRLERVRERLGAYRRRDPEGVVPVAQYVSDVGLLDAALRLARRGPAGLDGRSGGPRPQLAALLAQWEARVAVARRAAEGERGSRRAQLEVEMAVLERVAAQVRALLR